MQWRKVRILHIWFMYVTHAHMRNRKSRTAFEWFCVFDEGGIDKYRRLVEENELHVIYMDYEVSCSPQRILNSECRSGKLKFE